MINSWSLAYDVLNGTLDEEYPIMTDNNTITPQESDEYDPKPESTFVTSLESDEYDPIITVGSGNTASAYSNPFDINLDSFDTVSLNTEELNFSVDPDYVAPDYVNFSMDGVGLVGDSEPDKPKPDLKDGSSRKYQEDKGIEDLKNYVTSTYQGHYTNENSDVQTLDLIHSVGDAESFCRSNAIKYLSRYDKKGSAKNDILKAMHYCLLLYYFSGNTQSPDYTNTRYETF
tara:strand:+ start:358 stop:1047 length:690 start_codon:yes stop_codon:yes gene_type:complete